jgi:hypothetical protein
LDGWGVELLLLCSRHVEKEKRDYAALIRKENRGKMVYSIELKL